MSKYALHVPLLGKAELFNVKNCLKTGWLSSAEKYVKQLKKFEVFKINNANKIYKKIICLPSSYFLSSVDVKKISEIVKNDLKKK